MKYSFCSIFSYIFILLFSFSCALTSSSTRENFLRCFSQNSSNTSTIFEIVYTPNDPSYFSRLNFSIQNPRFSSPFTPKPQVIITPFHVSHVQVAVYCSRKHKMHLIVRSGGHDYEGLSYTSEIPFVILDLNNLRSINIDVERSTACVESGATLGEVYYNIAKKSGNLGFPAGICPTVGVGGHFSGGGYGAMLRKYGLAADNIIDAKIVNVDGRILDRKSMGEDLFWAIRGGGGASFGVVISWKIKLVPVPSTVTVFNVQRILAQDGTQLVHRWQEVAHKFHENLFVRLILQAISLDGGKKTIQVTFNSMFLGDVDSLLMLMQKSFPELGLVKEDCTQMSWIESTLFFNGFPRGQSLEVLLDRATETRSFKAKSDFVKEPIPVEGLEGIWERLYKEVGKGMLIVTPYGGKMDEISESNIPFPHRKGNIYQIQYLIFWDAKENVTESQKHISWIRRLYSYMTPYVSKSPREAYLNYRDLDIGTNNNKGKRSVAEASIWGKKYFKNNFDKLVLVKTMVDPTNFFKNQQSISPCVSRSKKSGHY
ncbi:tetrahydroberberine oxidase-like [Humulus lupulus]|uniref:tetrahydroberberine oxidase-like n=1 Tax=Humulus lupulus TaxID=3486 RepID=UPI002B409703|nr:tetrahydroberberine oxidase-like [Humulus lupulus]